MIGRAHRHHSLLGFGLGLSGRRQCVLAFDVVLGTLGVACAFVGALAGNASKFAGSTSIGPGALAGRGSVLSIGTAACEPNECLVAIVHGNDHVPPFLTLLAANVARDGPGVVLGFQSRNFVWIGPSARKLDERQNVACSVAHL